MIAIISDIAEDNDGTIFASTLGNGLYKLDRHNNIFIPIKDKTRNK